MARPEKKPSPEQSLQVSDWVKAKVSKEEMARRLSISPKTLRKQYATELGISPVITTKAPAIEGEVLNPPPGRTPAFAPSLEMRERVKILAGARISEEEIARKMGFEVEVLKEHFAQEIADGPATCKADIIESTYYAGRGGNVAAAKVYLTFNAQAQGDEDRPTAAVTTKGKKEIRQDRAEAAASGDSDWGADLESVDALAKTTH